MVFTTLWCLSRWIGTCLWKPWFKKDEPWVDLSEAVSSSWSRVTISSMGANHSTRRRTLRHKVEMLHFETAHLTWRGIGRSQSPSSLSRARASPEYLMMAWIGFFSESMEDKPGVGVGCPPRRHPGTPGLLGNLSLNKFRLKLDILINRLQVISLP